MAEEHERAYILGVRVNASDREKVTRWILENAKAGASRYVCFSTVHMIMESYDSEEFRSILEDADLVTTDGMPLVWVLRLLGHRGARRVAGPDSILKICQMAAAQGVPVGFYGGSPEVLEMLVANVRQAYPELKVVYSYSPPYRPLSAEEDEEITRQINASGARIVFVGLGCPKQERWSREHRGKIPAVILAVGAAFDFHAGVLKRAPNWLQVLGLEWFYRVVKEPRRLWKRYLKTNPRFVWLSALQILRLKRFGSQNA